MPTAHIVGMRGEGWELHLPTIIPDLRAQWHGQPVGPGRWNEAEAFDWRLHGRDGEFLLMVFRHGKGFAMEGGSIRDYADLVLWFRRLVPEHYPIKFYCVEELPDFIEVTMATTAEDLIQFFGGPLP